MKSDIIRIDNLGGGFSDAIAAAASTAAYRGLNEKESKQLQLLTEEMMGLIRGVTGEVEATFWVESEGRAFDLHLGTKTAMNWKKRENLIDSTTNQQNEAATTFLGKLRDIFEQAMAADVPLTPHELPGDIWYDAPQKPLEDSEWDGYEKSVLHRYADSVRIGIVGGEVSMIVRKTFE
ncbi:MAG: hypothetical protein IJX90_03425 [Blautia sp.]|nr:hypothetical protein [Blautia sp.]